jgi:hypothetical protein
MHTRAVKVTVPVGGVHVLSRLIARWLSTVELLTMKSGTSVIEGWMERQFPASLGLEPLVLQSSL